MVQISDDMVIHVCNENAKQIYQLIIYIVNRELKYMKTFVGRMDFP